jgi:hypothetical protein
MSSNFVPSIYYAPQCGKSNPGFAPTSADATFEQSLGVAYFRIQTLIAGVSFGGTNGAQRTQQAILRLQAASTSIFVTAATIAANGLSTNPYAWGTESVDYIQGLAACQALLPSL